ncbi:helix-turn-helix domain-containing protein [Methylobacterium tarhaniae]|uniref:helix-turn-helix domain-containing protein n=1 Tax=Methylobacterium tarhaniae TaxID=1187852 RepID=UPI003CFE6B2F
MPQAHAGLSAAPIQILLVKQALRGIALAAGLHEASCRQALHGINRKGADALADTLGVPFDELFPEGFVQSRRQASVKRLAESRQKRGCTPDTARARA